MSTPKKPGSPRPHDAVSLPNRQFAKSVARELQRRQRRRKLLLLLLLAAAIALAITYGTCGHGWGLGGGKGKGEGEGPGPGSVQGVLAVVDGGPVRCALRLTAAGITVDGKSMTREEAITACKATAGADIVVTGDARTGDWEDLQQALLEAKIQWTELKAGGGAAAGSSAPVGSGSADEPGSAVDPAGSADGAAKSADDPAGSADGGSAAPPTSDDAGV